MTRIIFVLLLTIPFIFINIVLFAQEPIETGGIEGESIEKEQKLREKIEEPKIKPPEITDETEEVKKPAPPVIAKKVFIKNITVTGVTFLPEEKINDIIIPYKNRELNPAEIQEVAGLVTDAYRQEGYTTSWAYIPMQNFDQDILEVRVIEGYTGEIKVQGNRYFRDALFVEMIALKEGGPFNVNILSESLGIINKQPDRKASAILRTGKEPGITDIIVEVKDRLPVHVRSEYDNYGSRYILKNRSHTYLTHNNLLGFGDILNVKYQLAEEGSQKLLKADYIFPVTEDFKIGFHTIRKSEHFLKEYRALNVRKRNRRYGINATRSLINQANCQFDLSLGFDYKNILVYMSGEELSADKLRIVNIGLDFNMDDKHGRTIIINDLGFAIPGIMGGSRAHDEHASCAGAGGEFIKNYLTVARTYRVFFDIDLLFRGQFQLSSDVLPNVEKFKLDGITNVRGYPRAEAMGDSGYALTLGCAFPPYFLPKDMRVPFSRATFYEALKVVAFYDLGRTFLRRPRADQGKNETLQSIGCAFRFGLPEDFSVRADFAWALGHTPSDGDRFQSWIKVAKGF